MPSFIESDIVFAEFPENLKVDLEVAKAMVSDRLVFTVNKMHYIIFDVSNVKEITPEAKEFLQRPEYGLKNILGAAFVATSPLATLIAKIFVKTQKDFQAKFFATREGAFEWILNYREKNKLQKFTSDWVK